MHAPAATVTLSQTAGDHQLEDLLGARRRRAPGQHSHGRLEAVPRGGGAARRGDARRAPGAHPRRALPPRDVHHLRRALHLEDNRCKRGSEFSIDIV